MKHLHLFAAVLLGITVVGVGIIFDRYIPASASDAMFFPGMAVGSLLFGHSVAMVYTALVLNILFYSLLSLGIIRLFTRRA